MPYPDARSHQDSKPETELDPARNTLQEYIGNAHTKRQTFHHTGGTPHDPYHDDHLVVIEESERLRDYTTTEEEASFWLIQEEDPVTPLVYGILPEEHVAARDFMMTEEDPAIAVLQEERRGAE